MWKDGDKCQHGAGNKKESGGEFESNGGKNGAGIDEVRKRGREEEKRKGECSGNQEDKLEQEDEENEENERLRCCGHSIKVKENLLCKQWKTPSYSKV